MKVIRILRVTTSDLVLLKDVGRVLLAAVAAAVLALTTHAATGGGSLLMTLAATTLAFGLTYAIALAALKILLPEEVLLMERQLERFGLRLSLRLLPVAAERFSDARCDR
jgi:hypothetical protein